MVIFTYNDYLDCIQNKKIRKAILIENKKQLIKKINKQNDKQQNEKNKKIDQIIEKLIGEKEEIAKFINDFFKHQVWKITKNNIEIYKRQNNPKRNIYKQIRNERYIIIKLQNEPDYNMPYVILTECTNFIKNWKEKNQNKRKLPIVIPIIIYNGIKNWKIKTNINMKYTSFKKNGVNLSYNMVDLHSYEPTELLNKKSLISNISILKKEVDEKKIKQLIQILKTKEQKNSKHIQIQEINEILLTR